MSSPAPREYTPSIESSLNHLLTDELHQCSQLSGGPAGPSAGTTKSPGRDGTATCCPSWAFKVQDGRPWAGLRALQSETCVFRIGGGRQGTAGECRGQPVIVKDGRGRWETAGDGTNDVP